MVPTKAYIIRTSSDISKQYAQDAAKSCEEMGLQYEFFEGVENKTAYEAWLGCKLQVKMIGVYKSHKIDKAACASVSHALVWDRIYKNKETAIVLEHDALLLHPINIEIPDNALVALGYKLVNPGKYDHVAAGPATTLSKIKGHEGAHAYAVTWKTAGTMLDELHTRGVSLPVDNSFFLKTRKSNVPLYIADPTPAIGWIRKSTIWDESSTINYEFIESFAKHYNGSK